MTVEPLPDNIGDNAQWLAQAIDPPAGMIRFVEMDHGAYRASSFLDDRMFQAPVKSIVCSLDEAVRAMTVQLRSDARWIFHIGHVGSTLVARLLGELEGVLSLREPRLLRDLTTLSGPALREVAPAVQRLMSRTFAADEAALVKATSFVSENAPQLVPPGERALFLFDEPRTYIETIMAGENSRKELRMLAGIRAERMEQRVSGLAESKRSDAHLAAAAWACEMTSLEAAADAMPDRHVHWAKFDPMLDRMPESLELLAGFFGFAADERRLREIGSGTLMRRYSKALEYDYSPGLRRELLAEARLEHRAEIDQAIAMLSQAAINSPYLDRALSRAMAEK